MNVLIIGGGWVGCHLYLKLKDKFKVTLYEKNADLISETSYYNQNRLHRGYHYCRNYKTRNLCNNTFDKFKNEYSELVRKIENNVYCIPENDSIVDFKTYLKIFDEFQYKYFNCDELVRIEGSIKVDEMYIDNEKTKKFFNNNIQFIQKAVNENEIQDLCKNYDFVINCTNNCISISNKDYFFELTLSLIYEKFRKTTFDSVTLVDGELFSIYPFRDNLYTLTDVEFTPIKKFSNIQELNFFRDEINTEFIHNKIDLFEKKVISYFPKFKEHFSYKNYFISTKTKFFNKSDDRYPVITRENNLISCFTGKIQGIYIIEEYIKNILDYE